MDTIAKRQSTWKSRDAWLCVLVLIVFWSIIEFWLRSAARSSPAFSHWRATPFGKGVTDIIGNALWVFVALWFSRVEAVRDFLAPAGLRRCVSIFGWCAAWLAIAIAFIDAYGASRGLTASSRQHHPTGRGWSYFMAWPYFTLSRVVIAPFCEEVTTRGFLYPAFRRSYSFLASTVIIICFSAYFHFGSVWHSLFTFGCLASMWALLCIVRERTGSLWDCLLCHAVYNLAVLQLWIPAVVVEILFLPFIMRRIWAKRRETVLAAPNRDA
jgi:membrane protease YdiL (CAAX protease family)